MLCGSKRKADRQRQGVQSNRRALRCQPKCWAEWGVVVPGCEVGQGQEFSARRAGEVVFGAD